MKQPFLPFLLLCCVLFSGTSFAQDKPGDIFPKFFGIYQAVGVDSAVDYLFSTNRYIAGARSSQDAIKQLKEDLKAARAAIGSCKGYDFLHKKMAGPNLILLTFLVRHEQAPLTFRILFYKPYATWQVQSLTFNDRMGTEMEEASQAGGGFNQQAEN